MWKIFREFLNGMSYLHKKIIHRDLKPQNIFIDGDGRVKIGDLVFAAESGEHHQVQDTRYSLSDSRRNSLATRTGQNLLSQERIGTWTYVAPKPDDQLGVDQTELRKYGIKSDIYSAGIIFFEMLYFMSTNWKKKNVIEKLRMPEIEFSSNVDTTSAEFRVVSWCLKYHILITY